MKNSNVIPGIGAVVVDGKLNSAMRTWKKELLESGKLDKLKEIRDGYIKPSTKRRKILLDAKHRQKFVEY